VFSVRLSPIVSLELAAAAAPPVPGTGQPVTLRVGQRYRLSCDARMQGGQPSQVDLVVTPEAPLYFKADVPAVVVAARTSALTHAWFQVEDTDAR
jgi:hypothetical protein